IEAYAGCGIGRFLIDWRRVVARNRSAVRDQEGRHIPDVFLFQLEIRHGGRSSVGLRIFQPRKDPFPRSLVGDVAERRSVLGRLHGAAVGQLDGVALHATVASQEGSSLVQLWRALKAGAMTLPAT